MTYTAKEIYYTLQGEGYHTGRPAVFLRFAGCNLWSGREVDRTSAICSFCDTEFIGVDGPGGGRFDDPEALAHAALDRWPADRPDPFVVVTGGEPMLQLDGELIDALHRVGFEIAIETNGTLAAPRTIDWICVSPKAGADLLQQTGDELKLVYPQPGALPALFAHMGFRVFSLQPMDGPELQENTARALEFCKDHPRWRLSLQTHKMLGIP